eukprot:gb/GFBE01061355.1/.p2 GENE.gb/GFBE01061355.1/~~gb/GFBE01061355.1/.p2  ORF type:complete len:110 (+),score=19.99 gb/GFBE01061355.1/:282-611(+)
MGPKQLEPALPPAEATELDMVVGLVLFWQAPSRLGSEKAPAGGQATTAGHVESPLGHHGVPLLGATLQAACNEDSSSEDDQTQGGPTPRRARISGEAAPGGGLGRNFQA